MQKIRSKAYSWLRGSEKWFKTDMVYLAKGGFWLTFGQVTSIAISFLLSIAFANLLSQYEYGTYKYIISSIGLIGVFSLSGLPTALTRSVAKGYRSSIWQAFFANIKWGILTVFVSGILGIYYLINDNLILGGSILIAGMLVTIIDSSDLYTSLLNGTQQFKKASIFRIIRSLFLSVGLFIVILNTNNIFIIVSTYFLLQAISGIISFLKVAADIPRSGSNDPDLIELGKHGSLMNNFSIFVDRIDNILVFQFLGPIQLAIYNFAMIIPNNISGVIKNLGTLAMPKFVQIKKDHLKATLLSKSFKVFVVGLIILFVYIICAPYIFELFFPKYLESVVYSQVYAGILLFSGALPVAFLDSQVAIHAKYKLTVVSGIFKLVSIVVGIIYFGIWGLIFARILSKIVGLLYIFILIKKV
jgi:Membrane protein involved in the export of O-antigen and teichoic acid